MIYGFVVDVCNSFEVYTNGERGNKYLDETCAYDDKDDEMDFDYIKMKYAFS